MKSSVTAIHWAIWTAFVIAWTYALLVENPDQYMPDHAVVRQQSYLISKSVHIGASAVFAVLSGWLRVPFRHRWLLIGFMVLHAMGTEYAQSFTVTRHPSWGDVGLDVLGITIGIGLSWRWWSFRPEPAAANL